MISVTMYMHQLPSSVRSFVDFDQMADEMVVNLHTCLGGLLGRITGRQLACALDVMLREMITDYRSRNIKVESRQDLIDLDLPVEPRYIERLNYLKVTLYDPYHQTMTARVLAEAASNN